MNFLLVIFFAFSSCDGLYLDVKPGLERCIGQELDEEDTATFKLQRIVTLSDLKDSKQKLLVHITNPSGSSIFDAEIGHHETQHIQNIEERGVYNICFNLDDDATPSVRVLLDIDFKARTDLEKRNSLISKKLSAEYIPTLEDELKLVEEILANVAREIEFARRQELILKQAGETTQSRIQWFSALSIIVLVCTTLYQLIYLRKYFMDKKIL